MARLGAGYTQVLTLEYPKLPPGKNRSYGYARGRVYLTKAARTWANLFKEAVLEAAEKAKWELKKGSHYAIIIKYCEGTTRRRLDVDAPVTLLMDSLTRALGFDDRNVWAITSERVEGETEFIRVFLFTLRIGAKE